jgi:hypothetical protein
MMKDNGCGTMAYNTITSGNPQRDDTRVKEENDFRSHYFSPRK